MGHIQECSLLASGADLEGIGDPVLLERRVAHLELIGRGHGGGGGGGYRGGGYHGGGGGYGRGWGYGYGHPWSLYYGMWYPWWFWLPATYYATQTPYQTYGVPPYPPQSWGNVPPPTAGQQGYAQVPGGGGGGVNAQVGYAMIPEQEVVALRFGKANNASFLEDHVLLTVELTKNMVAGRSPDVSELKANVAKWADAEAGQPGHATSFMTVMNKIIAKTAAYIAARVLGDAAALENARSVLQGALTDDFASFWDSRRMAPSGMDQRRFRLLLAQYMKQLVTDTASFAEDIVRGSTKEAVRSVREAVKQARKLGKLLDDAPMLE